jgi:hypothetical protein
MKMTKKFYFKRKYIREKEKVLPWWALRPSADGCGHCWK